jgi:2'-deoxynucleoside 5'-phosphate N-hydrolase
LNIYFSCAITGGRQDQEVYQHLVDALLAAGHEVPTAKLSRPEVMEEEAVISPQVVYQRDIDWVRDCEALVAEVTTPSHGVGYEIALAIGYGKPVFCCYRAGRRVSKMITGNTSPGLRVCSYQTWDELAGYLKAFLGEIAKDAAVLPESNPNH